MLGMSPEPVETPYVDEAGRKGAWAGHIGRLEEESRLDRMQSR